MSKNDSQYVIGSDGSMEVYDDRYKQVTDEVVQRAQELEQDIIARGVDLKIGYLRLARSLAEFYNDKLYLARGYPSFHAWAESPEIGLQYRTAMNLVRIANEAIPILQRNNALELLPSVSTMYDMLPILSDEGAEQKFVLAAQEVQGLTNRDAKQRIKEIRGTAKAYDEELPAIFHAQVKDRGDVHEVFIRCNTGDDMYSLTTRGPLIVKKRDWPRLERIFRNYVTIQED